LTAERHLFTLCCIASRGKAVRLKSLLGTYEDGYELQNVEGRKRYRARASLELFGIIDCRKAPDEAAAAPSASGCIPVALAAPFGEIAVAAPSHAVVASTLDAGAAVPAPRIFPDRRTDRRTTWRVGSPGWVQSINIAREQ